MKMTIKEYDICDIERRTILPDFHTYYMSIQSKKTGRVTKVRIIKREYEILLNNKQSGDDENG